MAVKLQIIYAPGSEPEYVSLDLTEYTLDQNRETVIPLVGDHLVIADGARVVVERYFDYQLEKQTVVRLVVRRRIVEPSHGSER